VAGDQQPIIGVGADEQSRGNRGEASPERQGDEDKQINMRGRACRRLAAPRQRRHISSENPATTAIAAIRMGK